MKLAHSALSWSISGFLEYPIDRLYLHSSGFPGHFLEEMAQHWGLVSLRLLGVLGCLTIRVYRCVWDGCVSFLFSCSPCSFLISKTCQVGHLDLHIFGFVHRNFGHGLADVTSSPGRSLWSSANERERYIRRGF